jgi:hypothetical protein
MPAAGVDLCDSGGGKWLALSTLVSLLNAAKRSSSSVETGAAPIGWAAAGLAEVPLFPRLSQNCPFPKAASVCFLFSSSFFLFSASSWAWRSAKLRFCVGFVGPKFIKLLKLSCAGFGGGAFCCGRGACCPWLGVLRPEPPKGEGEARYEENAVLGFIGGGLAWFAVGFADQSRFDRSSIAE